MTEFSPDESTQQAEDTSLRSSSEVRVIDAPERVGRYRVLEIIGRGGFGAVFRALDESLDREVAIKVPRKIPDSEEGFAGWMKEARMLAMLDHPNIVPVYDAGVDDQMMFYVVSKFIKGQNLLQRMQMRMPDIEQTVQWVMLTAKALHHAHQHGLFHRDVKPSNILIDQQDRPFLTDFGLAIQEEEIDRNSNQKQYVGTYSYMSPEQARGEGHLVDGRADVFSLGIVFYEMLTGVRPFKAASSRQLMLQIVRGQTKAVRLVAPDIPAELERICMKALARRRSDRYATADDFALDLQNFLNEESTVKGSGIELSVDDTVDFSETEAKVVPKGLRAFDEHDKSFFLKLVPGPCDSEGVPEIIRGLRQRLESRDEDQTFRVGLLYGSSGSGKSSLVKAGLIPLLDRDLVELVYVEATAKETEARLGRAVGQVLNDNPSTDLVARMAAVRRGAAGDKKVVVVIDQFEQWLHAHGDMQDTELLAAVQQCDGVNLQCLVLIRDDFWMPATRFFHELDIRLVQGVNSTAVDRFEPRHARYVLSEFGRAYGCLPEDLSQIDNEQEQFLDAIVDSVTENGKVISIHLVVLAQMLKGREWNLATLSQFGGTGGVDIKFLEQTFSDPSASPLHRSLEVPSRRVLAALLPEMGTNIKGQMREAKELRDVSGLGSREFENLLEVLDGELRLITPTVALEETGKPSVQSYQLTHDFLVPPLREWLTFQQRQTAKGRAKLRLRELSENYRNRQDRRFLPSGLEFARILALTEAKDRTPDEQKFMKAASRHHYTRWASGLVAALIIGVGIAFAAEQAKRATTELRAQSYVRNLLNADIANVPALLDDFETHETYATPILKGVIDDDERKERARNFARLALVQQNTELVVPLANYIPQCDATTIRLICRKLRPHTDEAVEVLAKLIRSELDESKLIRACYGLAQLSPKQGLWDDHVDRLAQAIVYLTPIEVNEFAPGFGELADTLGKAVLPYYSSDDPVVGLNAAIVLSNCYAGSDSELVELLVRGSASQFGVLYPVVKTSSETTKNLLRQELQTVAKARWPTNSVASKQVSKDAAKQIENAVGMIEDSFAFCQKLPWKDFQRVCDVLGESGYRPERVRPYQLDDGVFASVLWHRDARAWEFATYMDPETAVQEQSSRRKNGLFPTDLCRVPNATLPREIEYGVLWAELDESVIDAKMYLGVQDHDHADAWGPLNDNGYVPRVNLKLRHPEGSDRYSSVRWKLKNKPATTDAWNDTQLDYDSRILDGWHQTDLYLNEEGEFDYEFTYGAVWWNGGFFESETISRASMAEQRKRAAELARQNYRPISISVVNDADGPIAASVWQRPVVRVEEQNRIARRHANAAVALFKLGEAESMWSMLRHTPEPRIRSYLINQIAEMEVDPLLLLDRLSNEPDESRQFALIAALGQYRPEQLTAGNLSRFKNVIRALGTSHPSAGIHSICYYLCRKWGWENLESDLDAVQQTSPTPHPRAGWMTANNGHTLAVFPMGVEFRMGSPGHEPFRDHNREAPKPTLIPRGYAIGMAEVSVQQFREFQKTAGYDGTYTPNEACPMNSISWFQAARYCRWLGEQERIPENQQCYPEIDQIRPGMKLPKNYLKRTGYRLPTQAEWEYAARSLSQTSRYYGDATDLLQHYAWTQDNSDIQFHAVKSLIPNDFGLFDVLGNVMEWTQMSQMSANATRRFVDSSRISITIGSDESEQARLRGSAIFYPRTATRCAGMEPARIAGANPYFGFRIARTISAD